MELFSKLNITNDIVQTALNNIKITSNIFFNDTPYKPHSKEKIICINPSTEEVLTEIPACDAIDVDIIVSRAKKVFLSGTWSKRDPQERKSVLKNFADKILENQLELALLETLEVGKPISDSFYGNVMSTVRYINWYAESIDKIYGQVAPTKEEVLAIVRREPMGVIGAIVPWNFPLFLSALKIAPALAMGNSVVLKPAEEGSLSILKLAEIAREAGIPDGVLNIVTGFGEIAGQALARHMDINQISFTGSTEVGREILRASADSNLKPTVLECGGKSPNIILSDCKNLETAAQASISNILFNQGQVCCATSRVIMQRSIREDFIKLLLREAEKYQVGDPTKIETKLGPLISGVHKKRVLALIKRGCAEGAKILYEGKDSFGHSKGHFVSPMILDTTTPDTFIAQEEIFGPVLTLITVENEEEAVSAANCSRYGLSAAVWSENFVKAYKIASSINAGVVSINTINDGNITTPFGGCKESGYGREQAFESLYNCSFLKTIWIDLNT